MAESENGPTFARIKTSGAASRRSGASRPATPELSRTTSAGFCLDDHASYHGNGYHDHHGKANGDESSDETDLSKEESDEVNDLEKGDTEEIEPEVRDGIEDQRDLEAGPRLTKSKSEKSARDRDPNLVTWNGP